ncbi:molecular chaperone DnaJ [Roseospira visakhapatnamensis]|uniref:J domain-containing protein n=1 Tax=Roseospira visakhapatnamensis TaxID=390880 RepID=A0A7W6R9J9_9PROT|nr:molecular chaperone DnaJ [Roseospira visakhapatnamensis]MBB4264445.1 hypothetical protein [Roseospira visakhapatnamensis]
MLPAFILGLLLLVGVIVVSRWMTQANPRLLLRVLGWMVGVLIVVVVVFLAVTGRLAWAMAAMAALLPWMARLLGRPLSSLLLGRLLRGITGGSSAMGGFGPVGGAFRGARRGQRDDRAGQSEVSTRFLRMTLDHASGAMTGLVLEGRAAGRMLSDLTDEALAALWRETGADPDSRQVLEAWLDRARPDWRETLTGLGAGPGAGESSGGAAPPPGGGGMDRTEALALLGLEDGADTDAIQAAWRRLMRGVHPDHGGSPYLAARLNQARDLLLGRNGGSRRPG